MKAHFAVPILLAATWLALAVAQPAAAQILYENGPISGLQMAWTINFGFAVSDTFTISGGNSTVGGVSFGAWLFPGDVLESVEVSFTSQEFGGQTYFDQAVNVMASNCFLSRGYNVCQETGAFNGPNLANGTYWMNLQNAIVTNGDPAYWDENSGTGCHSQGCPSQSSENIVGSIPAESFSILGTTSGSSVPEPGSLLLFASGVVAIAGIVRRKIF